MPAPNFHSDETLVQRLIDGELDPATVRSLLQHAEDNPADWKQIAMAFVEDQQFRQSFVDFDLAQESPETSECAAATITPGHSAASASSPWLLHALSIAAVIAVAVTIGFILTEKTPIASPPETVHRANAETDPIGAGTPSIAATDPVSHPELTLAQLKPEYQMELPSGSGGGVVDLYRFNDLQRLLAGKDNPTGGFSIEQVLPNSAFSQQDRDRLLRSGYSVEEQTRFVSGRLEDGRPFVVPLRSIRLNASH